MNDQEMQAVALTKLGAAIAAVIDAGPLRHAKFVSVQVERDGGLTNVQAVIFTEFADLSEIMAARLKEPSTAERAGITPNPPVWDEAKNLLAQRSYPQVCDQQNAGRAVFGLAPK